MRAKNVVDRGLEKTIAYLHIACFADSQVELVVAPLRRLCNGLAISRRLLLEETDPVSQPSGLLLC